jgi:hypothetical protein
MVSVGTPEESMTRAATSEESGAHHAHRFGFTIGDEEAHAAGIPAERRPLSRGGIRNWTVGSLVGSALFAAVVAVALSQGDAHDARTLSAQRRPDAVPAQAAAAAPATTPPTAIPLESLPIAKQGPQKTARAAPKKTTHKAVAPPHVSLAQKTSTTTAVKSSSRALVPSRAKTMASAKTTAAKSKSASAR